jgi:hypothetical protein
MVENNQKQIYKMLHKLSFSVNEIPPLFVQLNMLQYSQNNQNVYWKEKARWIRFEENAEDVLGRWSKPFVSTVPYSAMDDLRYLIGNGIMIFDALLTDLKEISGLIFFFEEILVFKIIRKFVFFFSKKLL